MSHRLSLILASLSLLSFTEGHQRDFDDRFYALVATELYPRAAAYIREHPGEFDLPP